MERRIAVARDQHPGSAATTVRAREGLDGLDIHPDVLFALDVADHPELETAPSRKPRTRS